MNSDSKMSSIAVVVGMLVVLFSQVARYECVDKNSMIVDAVLRNPLEVSAIPDGIDLAGSLESQPNAVGASSGKVKSRRKRYLAFPEGASFSVRWIKM